MVQLTVHTDFTIYNKQNLAVDLTLAKYEILKFYRAEIIFDTRGKLAHIVNQILSIATYDGDYQL